MNVLRTSQNGEGLGVIEAPFRLMRYGSIASLMLLVSLFGAVDVAADVIDFESMQPDVLADATYQASTPFASGVTIQTIDNVTGTITGWPVVVRASDNVDCSLGLPAPQGTHIAFNSNVCGSLSTNNYPVHSGYNSLSGSQEVLTPVGGTRKEDGFLVSFDYPITSFELWFSDWGDYFPNPDSVETFPSYIRLIAYDDTGAQVAVLDGPMLYAGSASYDASQTNGIMPLAVTGENIRSVEVRYLGKIDPGVTIDDITYTKALPDLVVSNISFGIRNIKANAGSTVLVNDTVTNQGDLQASSFVVAYHLSSDMVYGNGDDIASATTRTIYSLNAGASNAWTTGVVIPADTPPGNYYLCANADDGGAVEEADAGNNWSCTTKIINVPKPDFVVTVFANYNLSVTTGETVLVTDSTKNQGGSQGLTGATAFDIGYVLSPNRVIGDGDDILLPTVRSLPSLGVNTTSTVSTHVTIPGSVAPGSYWVGAIADVNGDVDELKEGNNTKRASNKVTVSSP